MDRVSELSAPVLAQSLNPVTGGHRFQPAFDLERSVLHLHRRATHLGSSAWLVAGFAMLQLQLTAAQSTPTPTPASSDSTCPTWCQVTAAIGSIVYICSVLAECLWLNKNEPESSKWCHALESLFCIVSVPIRVTCALINVGGDVSISCCCSGDSAEKGEGRRHRHGEAPGGRRRAAPAAAVDESPFDLGEEEPLGRTDKLRMGRRGTRVPHAAVEEEDHSDAPPNMAPAALKVALRNKDPRALYQKGMELIGDGKIKKGRRSVTRSADAGYRRATYFLGRVALTEEEDEIKARRMFDRAARQGLAEAEIALGYLDLFGKYPDYGKGVGLLKKRSIEGSVVAQYYLGRHFVRSMRYAEAFKLFRQASNNEGGGHNVERQQSMYELAQMARAFCQDELHFSDDALDSDDESDLTHDAAIYWLRRSLDDPRTGRISVVKSTPWKEQAARQLIDVYTNGPEDKRDERQADELRKLIGESK